MNNSKTYFYLKSKSWKDKVVETIIGCVLSLFMGSRVVEFLLCVFFRFVVGVCLKFIIVISHYIM